MTSAARLSQSLCRDGFDKGFSPPWRNESFAPAGVTQPPPTCVLRGPRRGPCPLQPATATHVSLTTWAPLPGDQLSSESRPEGGQHVPPSQSHGRHPVLNTRRLECVPSTVPPPPHLTPGTYPRSAGRPTGRHRLVGSVAMNAQAPPPQHRSRRGRCRRALPRLSRRRRGGHTVPGPRDSHTRATER